MMDLGDNYVTGDNVYLRELQNFFFEVLGMMSITHYGAIGDGRRDNYGPLQVAIDDAHRRGNAYIYVPYGRFIYTGTLVNLDGITFMGNPHAKIVNIRTGEEIEIKQFGVSSGVPGTAITANLSSNYYTVADISDTIPLEVATTSGNGLSVNERGEVVIGENINQVIVSGSLSLKIRSVDPGNHRMVFIYHLKPSSSYEGDYVAKKYIYEFSGGDQLDISFPPTLIDVAEGDLIYIAVGSGEGDQVVGGGLGSTWLTVEATLVPSRSSGGATNYEYLNNKPKINGVTLFGDQTADDLGLQAELTAGDNIDITNNVIRTTGLQEKLVAGSNISIGEGNVISAFAGADTANRPILKATLSEDTALSTTSQNFPFDTSTAAATGAEYFSLSQNTIVVDTGVTKVLLSLHLSILNLAALKEVVIYKNSNEILTLRRNTANVEFDLPSLLLPVEAGDTISLLYEGSSGDIFEGGSYIEIEAVEIIAEVTEAFFSPISPTSWTDGEHSATASNTYGTWTITGGPIYNAMPYDLRNASDGNGSSAAKVYGGTNNEGWVELDLPEGVSISPRMVKINSAGSYRSYFRGYDGSDWELLSTITSEGGVFDGTKSISTNKFYTKFKYDGIKGAGSGGNNVYDIQITAGIVKY